MIDISIIYALAAMVSYGVSDFLVKKAISHTDALTFATIRTAITTAALFILVISMGGLASPSVKTWPIIALLGALGAGGYYAFSKAMESGQVSVVAPIINANTIVTIAFAGIFFGETLDFLTYAMIAGVIFGIILVSYNDFDNKKRASKATIVYSVITLVFWGILFAMYKVISKDIGPFMTAFLAEAAILVIFLPFFRRKKISGITGKGWRLMVWIGILVAAGVITFILGATKGVISIVSPIVSAATLVAVILGLVIYKERLSFNQYIGAAFIIVNVILLSMRGT